MHKKNNKTKTSKQKKIQQIKIKVLYILIH